MDVWDDSTGGDGGSLEELVELFVVLDGKEDVSWDDSSSLVVLGGVSGELEDLSGEVLKDGGEVDWGSSTDSLGVSSLLEESGDSSDWELESGSDGLGEWSRGRRLSFSSSSGFSWHFIDFNFEVFLRALNYKAD